MSSKIFVVILLFSNNNSQNILNNIEGIKGFTSTTLTYEELLNDGDDGCSNVIYDASKRLKQIDIVHINNANLKETYLKTEKAFREYGIDVMGSITVKGAQRIYDKHLFTIATFLIGASVIVILVGIISLVSISGLNVTERLKEIGIMQSFGTNSLSIFLIIFTENIVTGFLGFIVAILLSIPFSSLIGKEFGTIFLSTPLSCKTSYSGVIIWLLLTLIINLVVSYTSILKIRKMPVSKILTYE